MLRNTKLKHNRIVNKASTTAHRGERYIRVSGQGRFPELDSKYMK